MHRIRSPLTRLTPGRAALLACIAATASLVATTTANAAAPRCTLGMLNITLRGSQVGAGNLGVNVVFRNRTARPCTLYGYPGFGLEGRDHEPQRTSVVRGSTYFERDLRPHLITLWPGKRAFANLAWSDMPGRGEPQAGPCEPKSIWIEVTPPNAYNHAVLRFNETVCSRGKLTTTAVAPGRNA